MPEARLTFRRDGEGPLLRRGPGASVCSTLTSSEGRRLRVATRARMQGPRPPGRQQFRSFGTSHSFHLGGVTCALGPQIPEPPAPALLFLPSPGPCQPGPERHAGVVGTWSRSCGPRGRPDGPPEPPSCCSS